VDDELKLTWDDLIVENVTPTEAANWLADWEWFLDGQIAPIFLSRFGNWFYHRPDGSVEHFDVLEARVERIADDFPQFQRLVNTREWQEQYLYSALVLKYRREGIVARDRDAIAFTPHPAQVESLDTCKVIVMTMNVLQSIYGQTMRMIRGE
jgi:hypothetical protein